MTIFASLFRNPTQVHLPFNVNLHGSASTFDEFDQLSVVHFKDLLTIYADQKIMDLHSGIVCRVSRQYFFNLFWRKMTWYSLLLFSPFIEVLVIQFYALLTLKVCPSSFPPMILNPKGFLGSSLVRVKLWICFPMVFELYQIGVGIKYRNDTNVCFYWILFCSTVM